MIKRKYIKHTYIEVPYCDKCGAEMRHTGIVLSSYPAQYPYACTNPDCDGQATFLSNERPGVLRYEFEEEEENV